jgi:hypothetical protein
MMVELKHATAKGSLEFDPDSGVHTLAIDDPVVRDMVERYITTPRSFRVPESQQLDDFRIDRVKPVEDENYLMMALCEMLSEIGVEPIWPQDTED